MSLKKIALRGSLVLTAGETVVYAASFVRNMILARVLTKADFGVAATFTIIMMLFEFSAKLGVSRFVVRDKEGNDPSFVATAHMVQFGASLLSSLLLAVVAKPMAMLFGLRDHVDAIFALAALPIIQGLNHLDTRRFERELRFGPSALVDVIPQIIMTVFAWPVAVWMPDYRAILVLMVLKALLSWTASHWLAERPYRWRFCRDYALRMLRFGWPLLVNGFLLFLMLRADQFIVATFYSMSDFAAYAAAASVTMAPTFFFRKILSSVMLPVMAKAQDDGPAFNRYYSQVMAVICVFTTLYAVTTIIGAEVVMRIAFGPKYRGAGFILAWVTAANAIRNIRVAPAISAIAKGDSVNQMMSNIVGGVGLVPAFAFAVQGQPIWLVAASSMVGETLASAVTFVRLTRRDGVPLARSIIPTSLVAVSLALAGGICLLGIHRCHVLLALAVSLAAGFLCSGLVTAVLPHSRREAVKVFATFRSVGWRGTMDALRKAAGMHTVAVSPSGG